VLSHTVSVWLEYFLISRNTDSSANPDIDRSLRQVVSSERVPKYRLAGRLVRTCGVAAGGLGRAGYRRWVRRDRSGGWAVDVLYRLGPAYVKAAQLLSTRRDQLPPVWCDRLARLQDRVPPPPAASIAATLRRAYPDGPPFTELDLTPLASGSIATVHRAVLPDGRTVAVKVRRAGVESALTVDLALAAALARTARRIPGLRRVPLDEMVGQVGAAVRGQADLVAERRATETLRDNLSGLGFVRVPATYPELCTPDVVVLELVPDLRPMRPAAIPPEQRTDLVARTLTAAYQMLFVDGLVHCDLHHGNLYADPDGGLVLLDAGFVVTLPDRVRRLFAEFFLCMGAGQGERCAEIVMESAARIAPDCDRAGFTARLAALVAESTGASAGQFSLAAFATKLFDLQRRYHIYAAPEFAFPLLALLVIEGMVNELDRDVDFQALAIPVLMRAATPT
jgi:ubiquinone biosynthesis protein